MADKVFGTDFTNDTSPVSTYTISVNNGTDLVDVTLANLRKGMPVSSVYTSTIAPTTGDDTGDGYKVGDIWVETTSGRVFIATDVTLGAAVWRTAPRSISSASAPTVNDDSGDGYVVGDIWIETTTKRMFVLTDATAAAAVWRTAPRVVTSTSSPTINDDSGDGYVVGDIWINTTTSRVYQIFVTTVGAAVWKVLNEISARMGGAKLIWNSATSLSVGVGSCYAENGDFIDITSQLTASSLSLSANTWYNVYVYLSSGTPAMEVVTTAVAAWKENAYSKSGATSRRYIGSVRTDGSGNIYEFIHDPNTNLILYMGGTQVGVSPFRALNGGTATTATEVSLSSTIPATVSKIGYLRMFNLADKVVSFGDTTACNGVALNTGNTAAQNAFSIQTLTSTPGVYYKMASAVGVGGAYVDVYGYYYNR